MSHFKNSPVASKSEGIQVKHDRNLLISLWYDMLRIRKVELKIEQLYHLDEMRTPVHLCIGQEAVAVGVCATLGMHDYISSNHRGHGHYLAKGGDLNRMIAELYCRTTGCSKGRGGSMHLVDVAVGHIGSSSIVGGCIPIAAGLALSIQMKQQNRVSIAFFGDGAADEGVLYESVNFAVFKKLPAIFIYENNQFSVCSPLAHRRRGDVPFLKMPSKHIFTQVVDGNSVLEVYDTVSVAVERARQGIGPSFIECRTYRMRGHAGAGPDIELGYRSADEVASWEARCPIETYRTDLVKKGTVTEKALLDIERKIDHEIDNAFRFAQQSDLPNAEELCLYLYSE